MIDPNEIRKLVNIGMTEREAKLYLAMLQKHESDATELHRISGVVRTKTYEIVKQMVLKGYCLERVSGKQRYYHAIRPHHLRDVLKQQWLNITERRIQEADDIFGDLDEIYRKFGKSNRTLDFIEVIRNTDQSGRKFIELLDNSKEEILALCRSPYLALDPSYREAQRKSYFAIFKRKVKTRSVYMIEEETWSWITQSIQYFEDAGHGIRVSKNVPTKMFIFDRKIVRMNLPSIPGQTATDFTTINIEDPWFTDSCIILFETLWQQSYTREEWERREKSEMVAINK